MDERNESKLRDENPGGRDDLIEELSRAESRIEELIAERDALHEKVCDECDGSGKYYLINDETKARTMYPCVCVGETEPYQELAIEVDELKEEFDTAVRRIGAQKILADRFEHERDQLQQRCDVIRAARDHYQTEHDRLKAENEILRRPL